jgi:hypothetical protein
MSDLRHDLRQQALEYHAQPFQKTQQVRHIILILKRNLLVNLTTDIYYGYIFRQASGATEHGNLSNSTR